MPIKDINELLNMTLTNEKRKGKIRQQVQGVYNLLKQQDIKIYLVKMIKNIHKT